MLLMLRQFACKRKMLVLVEAISQGGIMMSTRELVPSSFIMDAEAIETILKDMKIVSRPAKYFLKVNYREITCYLFRFEDTRRG